MDEQKYELMSLTTMTTRKPNFFDVGVMLAAVIILALEFAESFSAVRFLRRAMQFAPLESEIHLFMSWTIEEVGFESHAVLVQC